MLSGSSVDNWSLRLTFRLNFSVLFGVMRGKLHQVLLGNCCPDSFQKLFERAAVRANVKIRLGRLYSRDKVGKPKTPCFQEGVLMFSLKLTPLAEQLRCYSSSSHLSVPPV
jgi:hypothetical protein